MENKTNIGWASFVTLLSIIIFALVVIQLTIPSQLTDQYIKVYTLYGTITVLYFLILLLAKFVRGEENRFPGFLAEIDRNRILSKSKYKWLVLIGVTLFFVMFSGISGSTIIPQPQPFGGSVLSASDASALGVSQGIYSFFISVPVSIFENAFYLLLIPSVIALALGILAIRSGTYNPISATIVFAFSSFIAALIFSYAHQLAYGANQGAFLAAMFFGFTIAFLMQITGTFWFLAHLLHNLFWSMDLFVASSFALIAFFCYKQGMFSEFKNLIINTGGNGKCDSKIQH